MPRPIIETLRTLQNGTLLDEAADKLSELVLAVDATGKPGKLTIEISLKRASSMTLAATGKIKLTKPAEPVVEALLWPTPEGNLLSQDPRQQNLDLKSVVLPSAADLSVNQRAG
jgi:hypothetical protein